MIHTLPTTDETPEDQAYNVFAYLADIADGNPTERANKAFDRLMILRPDREGTDLMLDAYYRYVVGFETAS